MFEKELIAPLVLFCSYILVNGFLSSNSEIIPILKSIKVHLSLLIIYPLLFRLHDVGLKLFVSYLIIIILNSLLMLVLLIFTIGDHLEFIYNSKIDIRRILVFLKLIQILLGQIKLVHCLFA